MVQQVADSPTGTVGVSLDSSGKPTFSIDEDVAWDQIAWSPKFGQLISQADAVYFGSLGQRGEISRKTIRRAMEVAEAEGITRILDINLRPPYYDSTLIRDSVASCSVLKLSDEELESVAKACMVDYTEESETQLCKLLERFDLELVVLTCGAQGAMAVTPTETIDQPGVSTTVRDAVGAGDSFTAAFASGLLRGDSLRVIMRKACEVAAAVCAQCGAVPELPNNPKRRQTGTVGLYAANTQHRR